MYHFEVITASLLLPQNSCKYMKLIEALLLELSESLKLLKEKCSVRVNLLSNNVIRALMKKKANISDKIINSALNRLISIILNLSLLKKMIKTE